MVRVVLGRPVALRAQALQPEVVTPALECEGATLDAANSVAGAAAARQEGYLRVADSGIPVGLRPVVGDGGGFEERAAIRECWLSSAYVRILHCGVCHQGPQVGAYEII